MELSQYQQYAVPALILIFFGWRYYRFHRVKKGLPGLLKNGALVVDVRSRGEFASGSSKGSINIPLDELESGTLTLSHDQTIILCCASGTRSAMAAATLKRKGFKSVINAGPWRNTVTDSQ